MKIIKQLLLGALILPGLLQAQDSSTQAIKDKIAFYKTNYRGPYKQIEWFCEDGTQRAAKDPCPDSIGGGIQHASYRDDLKDLGKKHHLYFADILAHTDKAEFWDASNEQSRLKQYQMARYLASVDNGWVQRKSQFYRGAIQSEDEQAWGIEFYEWLLSKDTVLNEYYFLLRQSLRDIPHDGDSNIAQRMRSESKIIADQYPKFMDARIKIHGKPSVDDIQMVSAFKNKHKKELSEELLREFEKLENTLREYYSPIDFDALAQQLQSIRTSNSLTNTIEGFLETAPTKKPQEIVPEVADILCLVRQDINTLSRAQDRLLLLDLSNSLEDILLRKAQEWEPESLQDVLIKIRTLSYATAGVGLIELQEWEAIDSYLSTENYEEVKTLAELNDFLMTARGVVEWSTGMVKANYQTIVDRYAVFEPLALGFIDDRVRSSVALQLGEAVSELGAFIAKASNLTNDVMGINGQSSIRGLNPGYAYGELVVVEGSPENVVVDTEKIYVFEKPPSDLKPVAGILTVSEGNLVSHVQLLARNLGIPNAALSDDNLKALKKYNGEMVFYAVSGKGNVIIKSSDAITNDEKALFEKKQRSSSQVTVPVEQIRLDQKKVLNMADVDASDSGKSCGPKAANLGQLKQMFPERVVEGLVIPFGIFKDHMDQPMPGQSGSYWEFLNLAFAKAKTLKMKGASDSEIQAYQLDQLTILRNAIRKMPLKSSFVADLKNQFNTVLGGPMGSVPVFLRSDTNMEDLEEFTGAGLNLTLFNILDEEKIINGIKDVWASPYTERSFKWRQQYLSNPENVFPSILIIPSVDVAYSGVLITKGINVGTDDDLTVAFSRGAGGAVDGQAAEARLITKTSNRLLSPARQPEYIRLPTSGGTKQYHTRFNDLILNDNNIQDIREVAQEIRTRIPEMTNSDYKGAYDVELGFENDKLWLFQIRPFVENKNAKTSSYLASITPEIDYGMRILLNQPIK